MQNLLAFALMVIFAGLTIYWGITAPVMIPTLIVAWVLLWLQARFECFN